MMNLVIAVLISFACYLGLGVLVGRFAAKYSAIICSAIIVVVWVFNTSTNMGMDMISAYKVMWSIQPTLVIGNVGVVFVMIGVALLGSKLGKKLKNRKVKRA